MDGEPEFPSVAAGDWFQTMDGNLFEVIAVDDDTDSIEVQFFDGTVAEFDTESWTDLVRGPAAPPEDWSGSVDISREDYGQDADLPLNGHLSARDYIDHS